MLINSLKISNTLSFFFFFCAMFFLLFEYGTTLRITKRNFQHEELPHE